MRWILTAAVLVVALAGPLAAQAEDPDPRSQAVLQSWYKLALELVRHTPTYTPPVASRTFGYLGVTAYEAVAATSGGLLPLAGQMNGLTPGPQPDGALAYDRATVLQAALAAAVQAHFSNTGPTGLRAMAAMERQVAGQAALGVPADVAARSVDLGRAIAAHVFAWSQGDGGAVIENMGFPFEYALSDRPEQWVPTSAVRQQQTPLLPNWGRNRPFVLASGQSCPLPPPPDYSEDAGSEFYLQAAEVVAAKRDLTDDQRAIARFWADDAMLSLTPPGHWISITLQVIDAGNLGPEASVDALARVGVAVADGFIGCWASKFQYDLLRPVTYIRRVIDPKWEPLLATPPFPEYPSGHSTQSGAAATVLTALFGDATGFTDTTLQDDGLMPRSFASFWAAAQEAGISRLYGGIHFRAAIERGLEQGRCIGAQVVALNTRVQE